MTNVLVTLAMICLAPCAWGQCVTIQQGVLTYQPGHYLAGQPLKAGFDIYGTNYQAHLFNSSYANNYLGEDGFPPYNGDDPSYLAGLTEARQAAVQATWYWPYRSVTVSMKWNEAWLSNRDCDNDGKLDRPASSIGSGAWLTNHQSDTDENGVHWSYFVKIVAVPSGATASGGVWYGSDGAEIGPAAWGAFAIVQEVYNDPAAGYHGLLYKSPTSPGFGYYGKP